MIGEVLKAMRKTKNFKQSDISEMTNIPQNTISQYETGKIQPTFEIIEKIANACGYEILFVHKKDKNKFLTSKNINRKEI